MKKLASGFLTLSLISLLVGCAGGADDDGKVNIEIFSTKPENVQIYQSLIKKFEEENPDIDVELTSPPDAETVLRTRLVKNDLPDIMSIGGNATYGDLARAGVLKDFAGEPIVEVIQPAYQEMVAQLVGEEKEGKYGLPFATNANTVIYNKAKFSELGLEVPNTWDELVAILEKTKAAGETPIYFSLKDAWTSLIPWNALASNLQGEDFAEKKNEGEASFQKNYSEVADKMLTLLEYGHNDNFGIGYNDGNLAFAKGESVFYLQGNWAITEIQKANPNIELGVFAMPVTNNSEDNKLVSGVDVLLAMTKETEHPEEAMMFIEFMLKPENAKTYIDDQKAFSAVKDVLQEDPVMEGIKVNFEKGLITSFADHYYPPGIQPDALIQAFLIEKEKDKFLNRMDAEWEKVQNR